MNRDIQEFALLAALGRAGGARLFKFFGWREAIDSIATIASGGYQQLSLNYLGINPPGRIGLEVISSDANDNGAGPGAQSVTVYGIDESGVWSEQTVSMNGTTAVALTGLWDRFIKVEVASNAPNIGTITVQQAGVGMPIDRIDPGHTVSRGSWFWVPSDYDCALVGLTVTPVNQTSPPSEPPVVHLMRENYQVRASWAIPAELSGPHVYAVLEELSPADAGFRLAVTNETGVQVPGYWAEGTVLMVPK